MKRHTDKRRNNMIRTFFISLLFQCLCEFEQFFLVIHDNRVPINEYAAVYLFSSGSGRNKEFADIHPQDLRHFFQTAQCWISIKGLGESNMCYPYLFGDVSHCHSL